MHDQLAVRVVHRVQHLQRESQRLTAESRVWQGATTSVMGRPSTYPAR